MLEKPAKPCCICVEKTTGQSAAVSYGRKALCPTVRCFVMSFVQSAMRSDVGFVIDTVRRQQVSRCCHPRSIKRDVKSNSAAGSPHHFPAESTACILHVIVSECAR